MSALIDTVNTYSCLPSTRCTADLNVDIEHAYLALRPGHRCLVPGGCLRFPYVDGFGRAALPPLCRHHNRPVFTVRGEHTVKTAPPGSLSCPASGGTVANIPHCPASVHAGCGRDSAT